ncbi:uncharacterized protein F5147DRAFT_770427 [Suillus discolor]|uniref:Uncharacterized protein n=1 Tax=Suillus discolor TaxID=1912936 RepID=A0A9P7JWQ4_9AGAM|nr:uncharacterized protein F5147DRAFT_770427 [Suillus discolor]KAG2113784.1 hypothetical protein F5147DRAFT_770427 [Suillus discolor]
MPGYAEKFHTLMQWEMETFVTPFINTSFLARCSATIPKLLHNVIAIMVVHKLVDRQPDVNGVLEEIKALPLSVNSATSDEYDIARMPDYFNAWWKENLGSCRLPDMLPKSSVQDVMELVEGHFLELPDHVETGLLPYMLMVGMVHQPEMVGSAPLEQCRQTTIGRELLEILQGRMTNLLHSSDKLAGLVGPVDELTRAVASSQSLMDQLNADDNASLRTHQTAFLFFPHTLTTHLFPQHMTTIPPDLALYQTYLAGELVYDTFMSKIHQQPVKPMGVRLLDVDTCIALEQLANVLAVAYFNPVCLKIDMVRYNECLEKQESNQNEKREQTLLKKFPPDKQLVLTTPCVIIDSGGRIIVWYLPGAMTGMIMTDMQCATKCIGNLLNNSITTRKPTEWRTHESNFYPSLDGKITPGCINISPAWFQQGREKHGFPKLDPENGFSPQGSTALKGDVGRNITTSLQRSGILVSAALRVMHPDLYRAGIKTQVQLGEWATRYQLHDMSYHLKH